MDVTALGELLIDFTCTGQDAAGYPALAAHPGGAPANFLAAVASFGGHAAMLGKVGQDTFGDLLIRTLQQAGIDTGGLVQDRDVFTTLAFVTLDETGNRAFSFARKPGADTCLREEELELSRIRDSRVFHFGTLSLTDEPARSATRRAVAFAREQGVLVSFDPNLRKPLWKDLQAARREMLWGLSQADVVKISDEEVRFLYDLDPEAGGERILRDYPVQLVFVTCGGEGCRFCSRKARGQVPALAGVRATDTTGAGDIFGGSAMWKLLQTGEAPANLEEEQLREIVRFACAAAGLSAERPGGISSVPTLEEVQKALEAWDPEK